MIAFTSSLLASLFLPTGCSMPGWSFCVRMPADSRMEVAQDQTDPVIYRFEMADGSNAFVAVGESTEIAYGGQWSERRQGLETVRWQANGDGRIDYYIERVWAEAAGIPRFLHAWVEASETGEISGAEELILTLRSCDPRMCPPLGPVAAPVVAEDSEEIERDEAPMEASEIEAIAEIAPAEPEVSEPPQAEVTIESEATEPEMSAPPQAEAMADSDATTPSAEPVRPVTEAEIQRSGMETIVEIYRAPLPAETEASAPVEAIADSDATAPADTAPPAEPVRPVTEAEIQRSGMETIVEVYRAPLPADTETAPPEAGPETDTETGAADAESAPVIDPDPAVESEDAEAETPPRRRSGPVMLTDGN